MDCPEIKKSQQQSTTTVCNQKNPDNNKKPKNLIFNLNSPCQITDTHSEMYESIKCQK
jgi:hypothetical protein